MTKFAISGHMGELLQGRLGPRGPVVLVTLPAPHLRVELSYSVGPFAVYQPQGPVLSRERLRALCQMTVTRPEGRWILRPHMPIAAGAGASTAALLALAKGLRPDWSVQKLQSVCLSLEGASDPLAHAQPEQILWASRQGRAVQKLPPLPKMQVVGGFLRGQRFTDPKDQCFPDISDLVAGWQAGCESLSALGKIVTEASRRRLAQQGEDMVDLVNIAAQFGAYGIAIAHTGTARAFLLPWRSPAAAALEATLRAAGWRYVQNYSLGGK